MKPSTYVIRGRAVFVLLYTIRDDGTESPIQTQPGENERLPQDVSHQRSAMCIKSQRNSAGD